MLVSTGATLCRRRRGVHENPPADEASLSSSAMRVPGRGLEGRLKAASPRSRPSRSRGSCGGGRPASGPGCGAMPLWREPTAAPRRVRTPMTARRAGVRRAASARRQRCFARDRDALEGVRLRSRGQRVLAMDPWRGKGTNGARGRSLDGKRRPQRLSPSSAGLNSSDRTAARAPGLADVASLKARSDAAATMLSCGPCNRLSGEVLASLRLNKRLSADSARSRPARERQASREDEPHGPPLPVSSTANPAAATAPAHSAPMRPAMVLLFDTLGHTWGADAAAGTRLRSDDQRG